MQHIDLVPPRYDTSSPVIPVQRSDGEPPYLDSLNHGMLIKRKIDSLQIALADTLAQLFTSADREYRAGRITIDDLAQVYGQARAFGTGFSKIWNENVSELAVVMQARLKTIRGTQPPPCGYWSGPYPYDAGPRPSDGVPVVYVLYDASNGPIYLGSTGHFGARMGKHKLDKPIAWWLAYPCDSREAAYLLEGGLLAARKPPMNVKASR